MNIQAIPHQLVEDDLPPSVHELVQVIGLSAALTLVDRHGGTRLQPPASIEPDHPLAKLIGIEAARALAKVYGGDVLVVPRCAAALRAARNRDILRRHAAGESAARLARACSLTERQIWNILAQAQDNRQSSMF